ncbi:MAG: hypothetical protein AAF628_30885 [Planctomycetota bacterium]
MPALPTAVDRCVTASDISVLMSDDISPDGSPNWDYRGKHSVSANGSIVAFDAAPNSGGTYKIYCWSPTTGSVLVAAGNGNST